MKGGIRHAVPGAGEDLRGGIERLQDEVLIDRWGHRHGWRRRHPRGTTDKQFARAERRCNSRGTLRGDRIGIRLQFGEERRIRQDVARCRLQGGSGGRSRTMNAAPG